MPRLRKLQDPAILQELERGLVAGESLNLALARLDVSRSTFEREMARDDALRRRFEAARLAGQAPREMATARDAPAPVSAAAAPAAEAPAAEVAAAQAPAVEVPAAELPAVEVPAAEMPADDVPQREVPAPPGGYGSIASGAIGSGHVVFGTRRPRPLATVRRMAMRSATPRVAERSAPRREPLAVHDWLPALLLLLADVALALTVSENFLVIAPIVAMALAYVAVIRLLSRAAPAAAPAAAPVRLGVPSAVPTRGRVAVAWPQATPTDAKGRAELNWVRDTIGDPVPGISPVPRPRHRPRD